MMENGFFGVPVATDDRNAIALDGSSLQMTPSALDQLNLDNQNQRSAVYTGFSAFPREQIDDLHTDFHTRNQSMAVYSDALVASLGRNIMIEALPGSSSCPADIEFQEQFVGAMPISSVALATLLDARSDLQDNLSNLAISGASCCPPEFFRTVLPNDCSNASNSSSACSMSHGGVEVFGNTYGKGGLETISAPVGFSAINPIRVGFQPYSACGSVEGNSWMSSGNASASRKDHYDSSTFTNELSLSLATSQPSVINSSSIPDQCSVIDCPGVSRFSWKETRLSSEQTSCNSKELALSCGSHGAGQFSQAIGGSRYLQVIQEILSQIASYLIENLDLMSYSVGGTKSGANNLFSSGYHVEGGLVLLGSSESPNGGHRFELEMDPALQKRGLEAKKRQLLTLLEVVDSRYNQCLDEIHTVISAFHAATELDPQIHTRFALQTITFLYRSLRERISNQILVMGAHFESSCAIETGGSSEPSYFQNQYTLQQLKKRDHQLWRPQRGLPERSVSVLRAWMFQNFLHPYPKDSEKHLLAIKSGLTRSQVSNWFINARVRLWKPMIEEMYAEMNRRKPLQKDEETNSSHRSQITLGNHGFNLDES